MLEAEIPKEKTHQKDLELAERDFELKKKQYELLVIKIQKLQRAQMRIRLEEEPLDQVIAHLQKNLEQIKQDIKDKVDQSMKKTDLKEDLEIEIQDHLKQLSKIDQQAFTKSIDFPQSLDCHRKFKQSLSAPQSPIEENDFNKKKTNKKNIEDEDSEDSEYGEELSIDSVIQTNDPINYRLLTLYSSIPTIVIFLLFYAGLLF